MAACKTLYVRNLDEKVKKGPLKRALYAIFSQFGKITRIHAAKTLKLKGQAWLDFETTAASSVALKQMQSFPLFGKPMAIAFAAKKGEGKVAEQSPEQPAAGSGSIGAKRSRQDLESGHESEAPAASGAGADSSASAEGSGSAAGSQEAAAPEEEQPGRAAKRARTDPQGSEATSNEPSKVLFADGLGADASSESLAAIFGQFAGFESVRLVPGGKGMAFVTFQSITEADVARRGLDGTEATGGLKLSLGFAK